MSRDERGSLKTESPSEGMESIDMVLVDRADPMLQSLTLSSSLSAISSGGERSNSRGLRPSDQLSSFSEPC